MNAGSVVAKRSGTVETVGMFRTAISYRNAGRIAGYIVVAVFFAMALSSAGAVLAQTPDEACAADSLYLISPDELDLRLETTGRTGLTISWPNLDLNQATCFSLKNTDDLGFQVGVTGGFGDRVDRVFEFTSPDSGLVGVVQPENIVVTWRNAGPSTYGNIGGVLNLSNNGGIWRYDNGSGWRQQNGQLPMTWLAVNTVGLAAGSGDFMVAGFSRGSTPESDPVGLFSFDGTSWSPIATDVFGAAQLITDIAVSPTSNDMYAVGTARDGLFITTDGGLNFTQWTSQLDPGFADMPTNFQANVVEWSGNRVFVFLENYGLFISQDNGQSFTRSDFMVPETLDGDPPFNQIMPVINALSFHPDNPDRVAAALLFHGAYESLDGGVTWTDLYGDLVVPDPDPEISGAWVHTGLDFLYDDVNPQTMLMGVKQNGLYRTTDGGATWVQVAESLMPANRGEILNLSMTRLAGSPGVDFLLIDEFSLLVSSNSGATWSNFFFQPVINRGLQLFSDASGNGDLVMGSYGGGVYLAGTPIPLTETYSTITSDELRGLDLGLDITFGEGEWNRQDSFELVCQTFQGWAVWRGASNAPQEMTLLGLYDRVNPEDCFEGFCGDQDIVIIPNCFAAKRAACFNLDNPDTIRFFDEEIYNGFTYNYSVTSFDYGNTALTTPENNSNEMIFSPRFEGDQIVNGGVSPFPGPGNQTPIQINQPRALGEDGWEEIYVFPNPLREGAGFPRDEGGTVTFANIPDRSKILVFTSAGDRVVEIGAEAILEGNIHWDTRNDSGESITSGVFLYKVEIPDHEAYWGRLVVIR